MDIKEFQVGQIIENESNHPWEMARFSVINDVVSKFLYKEKLIGLDLGCGDIFFLDQFSKKHKGTYYAVDIAFTKDIMEKLKIKYQNPTITLYNSLENIHENQTVDIAFVMDVIEHIEQPVDLIKTLLNQQYIDKNSLFLITVPAHQCLFSNHDKWMKRYSSKLLEKELTSAGLQIIDSGSFFTTLIFTRLFIKILEIVRRENFEKTTGAGGWNHGKTITNVVKSFLKTDYYFFGKFFKKLKIKIPGLSLYAVCKLNS